MKKTNELNKQKTVENLVGATIGRPRLQRLGPNKGITLVAIIITIVIMLILATVTVNVVIDGGLFEYAGNTKDSVEVASEKETIKKAFIFAESASKTGRITKTEMQKSINQLTEEKKAKVYEIEENFLIIFETRRAYTIDNNGKILEMVENYENPSKKFLAQLADASYGTAEKPYEINCIEDLVDLSFAVNGIEVLEDGTLSYTAPRNSFKDKYINLIQNINFTSELSYEDITRTDYGDINGNGKNESLLTELTTGKGWIPIGDGVKDSFYGNFDGLGNKISNLYMYNEEETSYSGLFGRIYNGSITNIDLSGNIYCNSDYAAGILARYYTPSSLLFTMDNCSFSGKIENINTDGYAGGLYGTGNDINISNSYNEATIISAGSAGGICSSHGNIIFNCYNTGHITAVKNAGGISADRINDSIENCYNTGLINSSEENAGGIIGESYGGSNYKIYRCYNTGDITGHNSAGILGYNHSSEDLTIEQCYNSGDINSENHRAGGIVGTSSGARAKTLNCYNTGEIKGTIAGGIIGAYFNSAYTKTAITVSCYNTGLINGTTKNGVQGRLAHNSYYLSSCGATDKNATSVADDVLKASASILDKAYTIDSEEENTVTISEEEIQNLWVEDTNNINDGYPTFSWQLPQQNSRRIKRGA